MSVIPADGRGGPSVTFLGAAQTVTGSMHLVQSGDERILLDCGSSRMGKRRARVDVDFPFPADTIDAVVLSHAHMDHCGNLPHLVSQGYDGPIYCTPATRKLTALMLGDSARVQDDEDRVLRTLDGLPGNAVAPPTAGSWVSQTVDQLVSVPYGKPAPIARDAQLRFIDAGHILGSAMAHLTLGGPGREVSVTFTGDLGRRGLPFLSEADPLPAADLLICESTYGGRWHQTADSMARALAKVMQRSANDGGVVLIPAFSLGRTQLVVHYLRRWMRQGLLPKLPMYVDSPLAADIAEVYAEYYPPAAEENHVAYIRTHEESDDLEEVRGPCVIVASGGMCEGGRIVKHLRRRVDDPRASLVLVSYQAPDSLGRKFLEKKPTIFFHGKTWNKWIDVLELNGFSGHADHADLLAYLAPLQGDAAKIRLVHGEPEASQKIAASLQDAGFADVANPARGESVALA